MQSRRIYSRGMSAAEYAEALRDPESQKLAADIRALRKQRREAFEAEERARAEARKEGENGR